MVEYMKCNSVQSLQRCVLQQVDNMPLRQRAGEVSLGSSVSAPETRCGVHSPLCDVIITGVMQRGAAGKQAHMWRYTTLHHCRSSDKAHTQIAQRKRLTAPAGRRQPRHIDSLRFHIRVSDTGL